MHTINEELISDLLERLISFYMHLQYLLNNKYEP
jgi:hypothetical protein